MEKIFCTITLLLIANTLDAQHKTLTLHYPDDSTNVISISNLDSMAIFICGASKVSYGGKDYNTVLIGNQCWLKENLDVGTMITSLPGNNGIIEKYCYDNNAANCSTFGGLYTWDEAMQYVTTEGAQGICPDGWHMPTEAEYQVLIAAVSDSANALKKMIREVVQDRAQIPADFQLCCLVGRNIMGLCSVVWDSGLHSMLERMVLAGSTVYMQ